MAEPPPDPAPSPPIRLDAATLAKQVSKVRHDLRNPLAHILGFTEMLIEKASGQGLNFLKARLQLIERTAHELTQRVTSELDPDHLQAGTGDLADLQQSLLKAATRIRQTADSLRRKPAAREDPALGEDLARIGGAATRLLELTDQTLISLQEQFPHSGGPAPVGAPVARLPDDRAAAPGGILVLGPSTAVTDELRRILLAAGHNVQLVESEDRLWPLLASTTPPELLILELERAQAAERALLRQLHERLGPEAPAILVIAPPDQLPAAAVCLEAGAEDCLTKPFLEPIVRARVGGCLARRQLRRSRRG